ncbi:MAG: hypothetical protein CM1200mP3_18570 [Chloroflexota bacterium]|nr:MAG: hypothetical protein CM1200mP3_18570 [Chloroflexota bacterium]
MPPMLAHKKYPFSRAKRLYASIISESLTDLIKPPDSSLAETALRQLAGFPILMAEATVLGFTITLSRKYWRSPLSLYIHS